MPGSGTASAGSELKLCRYVILLLDSEKIPETEWGPLVLRCPMPTVLELWASSSFSTCLAFSYFFLSPAHWDWEASGGRQAVLYCISPSHYDELKVVMTGAIALEAHSEGLARWVSD